MAFECRHRNWNGDLTDDIYLNKKDVVCIQNKRPNLDQLEQTGTEIGTQNLQNSIKNRECSNVPIYFIKSSMGEKKEKK